MVVALLIGVTGTAESGVKRLRVDSVPAGATVSSIVGKLGVTPLSISERDIYPNTYPDEKLDMYGKVIISKSGCKAVTRRISIDDIKSGLDVQLECEVTASARASDAANEPPLIFIPDGNSSSPSEILSDRRLRQLKMLNELLEDKLISGQEERMIRMRIFKSLEQ